MQIYLVGGAVRDKLMNKTAKDFDFTVVLEGPEKEDIKDFGYPPFDLMTKLLELQGFKIFVSTPEHLTVRAQFPVGSGGFLDDFKMIAGGVVRPGKKRLTADFVLARKEGTYTDGRRPDSVSPGTLHDDLARRDFTMNAIAMDQSGNLIDPFGGQDDIRRGLIKTVGDPVERMMEDSLRALRALRFYVTTGFNIHVDLAWVLENYALARALRSVSDERKMDELNKMLRHDTLETLKVLNRFPTLRDAVFDGRVNLEATMKQKGYK